jgi:hypothetical protein
MIFDFQLGSQQTSGTMLALTSGTRAEMAG